MAQSVIILGAGGFGRAVLDALRCLPSVSVTGFLDDGLPAGTLVDGLPVLGASSQLAGAWRPSSAVVVAVGNNAMRARLARAAAEAGIPTLPVVHPRAVVAASARIGQGAIVMAGAVIGANAQVGDGCIVNYGAVLDHDCQLGAHASVGAGACLGGGARLGDRSSLPAGASLPRGAVVAADIDLPLPAARVADHFDTPLHRMP